MLYSSVNGVLMRADRLLSILMYLQTRGRTTTDRLAQAFEVSRRTIIRDLYALRVAGFPVYTERGPHGGCFLHDEYRNTLTQLTTEEIASLFVSTIATPLEDLGLSQPLRGAVLKLTAALPPGRRREQSRIGERIVVDGVPWGSAEESGTQLSVVHQALIDDRWLAATFVRPFGVLTERRIAPYGLVAKAGTWWVVWAGEDGQMRVDRISRLREATLEPDGFERTAGFDLNAFWADWRDRQEAARPSLVVTLRVRVDGLAVVEDALGAREGVFYGNPVAVDEWVKIDATFPYLEEARKTLLALGGAVEVLAPEALRRSIADFAEQAAARYRPAATGE